MRALTDACSGVCLRRREPLQRWRALRTTSLSRRSASCRSGCAGFIARPVRHVALAADETMGRDSNALASACCKSRPPTKRGMERSVRHSGGVRPGTCEEVCADVKFRTRILLTATAVERLSTNSSCIDGMIRCCLGLWHHLYGR